jgi:hypothetical protein
VAGKLEARREDCAPVDGKSTLNRLELSRAEPTQDQQWAAIESLFVTLFLDTHKTAPKEIILDLERPTGDDAKAVVLDLVQLQIAPGRALGTAASGRARSRHPLDVVAAIDELGAALIHGQCSRG